MLRRMLLSATLAACALAPVWAAERATYVLTNGERHNGTIVYGQSTCRIPGHSTGLTSHQPSTSNAPACELSAYSSTERTSSVCQTPGSAVLWKSPEEFTPLLVEKYSSSAIQNSIGDPSNRSRLKSPPS